MEQKQTTTIDWFRQQQSSIEPSVAFGAVQHALERSLRVYSRSCIVQNDDLIGVAHYAANLTDSMTQLSDLVMVLSEIIIKCDEQGVFDREELVQYKPFVDQIREKASESPNLFHADQNA